MQLARTAAACIALSALPGCFSWPFPMGRNGNAGQNQTLRRMPIASQDAEILRITDIKGFQERYRNSPLHDAVIKGDYQGVKSIVERGFNINQIAVVTFIDDSTAQMTALDLSALLPISEIRNYLLSQGAKYRHFE